MNDFLFLLLSVGVQTPVPAATLSVQKRFAEIEELSLKTPRPVASRNDRHCALPHAGISTKPIPDAIMPRHN
ncbi:hypothetical protein ABE61_02080 [Lysinibacillus sphaericus]|nr:hypothetical protein [Lysinibacillus sphaericus]MBG9480111.1 hypothetical protein [Lysinibacillus sphaericus]MBG9593697.1 hypothetical protein [Lysinibacillus sphaericus]